MNKTTTPDLGTIRAAVAALQAERTKLQRATRDQSEARAEIAAYVAQAAEAIGTRLRYAVATGIDSDLLIARPRPDGAVDLAPALVALLGREVLTAALSRYVDELPPASVKAERAARLAEIAAELENLERKEEDQICALEAQGLTVDRRAQARPEIILAIRN